MSEKILAEGVEAALGERLLTTRQMGGGCIGEVYKVELADGTTLVAKVDREAESHLEREAYMLRYLQHFAVILAHAASMHLWMLVKKPPAGR